MNANQAMIAKKVLHVEDCFWLGLARRFDSIGIVDGDWNDSFRDLLSHYNEIHLIFLMNRKISRVKEFIFNSKGKKNLIIVFISQIILHFTQKFIKFQAIFKKFKK
jgi:hypothetical protein